MIIDRLEKMLKEEEEIPVKDAAGIITPKGIDAKVRLQVIRECLNVVKEELGKD